MATVLDITTAVARDVQAQLGPEHPALVDYTNRIHLDLLKLSRWSFLESTPQRFLTKAGQTAYWLGPAAQCPIYMANTGLALVDVQSIRPEMIFDRTNDTALHQTNVAPDLKSMSRPDASSRPGKPAMWNVSPATPQVLNIYPAPDNQNSYQPVPQAPLLSTATGGSLPARTYYVTTTFVDSNGGESVASLETSLFIPAGALLVVAPPQPAFSSAASGITYNQFRVYVSETAGAEQAQSTALAITGAWTEPVGGLVAGAVAPTTSTIAPLGGYVIEFSYYKTRAQLTWAAQLLQVPDDYTDVIVAGVNGLAFQYLGAANPTYLSQAKFWTDIYENLKLGVIRDSNLNARGGGEYITPDSGTLANAG